MVFMTAFLESYFIPFILTKQAIYLQQRSPIIDSRGRVLGQILLLYDKIPDHVIQPEGVITSPEEVSGLDGIKHLAYFLNLDGNFLAKDETHPAKRGLLKKEHRVKGQIRQVVFAVDNKVLDAAEGKTLGRVAFHVEDPVLIKKNIRRDPLEATPCLRVEAVLLRLFLVLFGGSRMGAENCQHGEDDGCDS